MMDNTLNRNDNVFFNRNFRLVFFGALVSELGALLFNFAVSFYILEITGSNAFEQGLYLAVCGASMLLFTPLGGVLGDRFNKAVIMYICDFIKGGMIILAAVFMLLFNDPGLHIAILFVLGILSNAAAGIFTPASGALFPHIVQDRQLQQANAYITMKNSLEGILGVILAGILYSALPICTLFVLVGLCYTASGISELFIRYDHHPSPEKLTLKAALRDMHSGLAYLKSQKAIMVMIGAILFINFFSAPLMNNFIPYFIKTDLAHAPSYLLDGALTPELWSSVFSVCFGISSLIGALLMSARPQEQKCGYRTALRLCLYAGVMIMATLSFWQLVDRGISLNAFLVVFSIGCLLLGCLVSCINIPILTAMMRIVDKDMLSKVTSIGAVGSQGMIPLASLLAGVVLGSLGSTPLLAFCSLGFTATALFLLGNRSIREF